MSAVARVRPDALRCFVDEDVTRSTREVLVDEHRVPCGVGLSQFVPVEVLGRPSAAERHGLDLRAVVRVEEDQIHRAEVLHHTPKEAAPLVGHVGEDRSVEDSSGEDTCILE